jgi:glycosyltransferase involved in cell wall biosynthesis
MIKTNFRPSNLDYNRAYRVVLIHPSAGTNWSGGTENFAIELTNYLSSYFNVELLAGGPCSPYSHLAGGIPRNKGHKLLRNRILNSCLKTVSTHPDIVLEHATSFLPCTIRLLRKPADLIFPCNDYGGLAVAALVRKIRGTPFLFKASTGLTGEGHSLKRCLSFCPDHTVVFSETMMDFVLSMRPKQSVSIIHNGVDLKQFRPDGKQIELDLIKPIVICVASLNRNDHKRVELAIRAVSRLSDVSLLICGDGPDRNYFQSLGDKLLGRKRFAIRTFPFTQMPEVYRCAKVFTLPSLDEPFSQAYIQAMASGLPVVVTDDEMAQYIVADSGILCDVTNPDIYAEAIVKALGEDWTKRSVSNANRFSWDTVAGSYRDLIWQMIAQSIQSN